MNFKEKVSLKVLKKIFYFLPKIETKPYWRNFETKFAHGTARIVVIGSGKTSETYKSEILKDDFILCTNNSGIILKDCNLNGIHCLNDENNIWRDTFSLLNYPKSCKKLFWFFELRQNDHSNRNSLIKRWVFLRREYFYAMTDNPRTYPDELFIKFAGFLDKLRIPFVIQNSGVFCLLFGAFLATENSLELVVYGLDLEPGRKTDGKITSNDARCVIQDSTKRRVAFIYQQLLRSGLKVTNNSKFKLA